MRLARRCLTTPDLLPSKLVKTRFPLRFASVLMLTTHVLDLKYHKRRNKTIQILNTKIPTDPYKMVIFPVGIPYSLQKPKNPYRWDFPYEWQHCVHSSCLQRQVPKLASRLFYYWSLLRNNYIATNLQVFTWSYGRRRFAACDCWKQTYLVGNATRQRSVIFVTDAVTAGIFFMV